MDNLGLNMPYSEASDFKSIATNCAKCLILLVFPALCVDVIFAG